MNKKGIVLIFSIFMLIVIAMSMTVVFFKSVNENNYVKRRMYSMKAFWLAETGVAETIGNSMTGRSGTIPSEKGCPGNTNCEYNTVSAQVVSGNTTYYNITSTGSVNLLGGGTIARNLEVFVKITPPDPANFGNAIETTGILTQLGGAVTINGTVDEGAVLNFSNLFGSTKEDVRNVADQIYNEITFTEPLTGVTWVDDDDGAADLVMNGNLTGSGILIIEGDVLITGTVTFEGIIYVIGGLTMLGNATLAGTVLAESGVGIDTTVGGSATITYDPDAIGDALDQIAFLSYNVSSWREID